MSRKERERITVMQGVKADELNQVQAATRLAQSGPLAGRVGHSRGQRACVKVVREGGA